LERAHLALIAGASRLLYIETQFLRSRAIAAALAEAARARPDLGLILILPAAPEAVAFDGRRGLPERWGERLQAEAVTRVAEAFGPRAAIVSPVRRVEAETGDESGIERADGRADGRGADGRGADGREADDRAALGRAEIIYVHSKVLIADDAAAIIGSANLNGRSLRWDTEAGVAFADPTFAAELRRKLSRPLVGDAAAEATPERAVAAWRA
ncbi:MAG: phospholipase D-like domain-containing protein, partial [Pseudomonadota bacterium]